MVIYELRRHLGKVALLLFTELPSREIRSDVRLHVRQQWPLRVTRNCHRGAGKERQDGR